MNRNYDNNLMHRINGRMLNNTDCVLQKEEKMVERRKEAHATKGFNFVHFQKSEKQHMDSYYHMHL